MKPLKASFVSNDTLHHACKITSETEHATNSETIHYYYIEKGNDQVTLFRRNCDFLLVGVLERKGKNWIVV